MKRLDSNNSKGWWYPDQLPAYSTLDSLESAVQGAFLNWLSRTFPLAHVYNTPARKYIAGVPDLIITHRRISVHVEVKAWGKTPSKAQEAWLYLHAKAGGVSIWGMDSRTLSDCFLRADLAIDEMRHGKLGAMALANHTLYFNCRTGEFGERKVVKVTGQIRVRGEG